MCGAVFFSSRGHRTREGCIRSRRRSESSCRAARRSPEAAMATRRRGRGCWERSPPERRPPAGPPGPRAEEEAASPPVLSLSHFCRSPFLCFGDVRLGASRTLPLALDNPNEETADVRLSRVPAAEQGFSIWPSAFVLQVGWATGVGGDGIGTHGGDLRPGK